MAKIERGRVSGFNGMESHTAEELYAWADKLEAQIDDPENTDDTRYLRRWAAKMRKLASRKEKARQHKNQQRKSKKHQDEDRNNPSDGLVD